MVQTRRRDGKFGSGTGTADRGWSRSRAWHDEPVVDEHGRAEGSDDPAPTPKPKAAAKKPSVKKPAAKKPAAPTPAQQSAAAKRDEKARQAERARKANRAPNRALLRVTKLVAKRVANTIDNDRPI